MVKVLIAEDDLLIADLLEDVLADAGYEVCGQASSVAAAVDLCALYHPDLAVIDVRLADGGIGTDVAALVADRAGLGILYATGNASHVLLTATDGEACITKPYDAADIVRALEIVHQLVRTGKASRPYPRKFQLLRHAMAGSAPEESLHGKTAP